MTYSISDDVPEHWNSIIDTFITAVEYSTAFNRMPEVENLEFSVNRGLLAVRYSGGDEVTDGFALFAREMSGTICGECGDPSTRKVFGSPRCSVCV